MNTPILQRLHSMQTLSFYNIASKPFPLFIVLQLLETMFVDDTNTVVGGLLIA